MVRKYFPLDYYFLQLYSFTCEGVARASCEVDADKAQFYTAYFLYETEGENESMEGCDVHKYAHICH